MDRPTHLQLPLPDLEMVYVEGGTFDMGDAVGDLWDACRPVHPVQVSSFYIGKYQVTQRLWQQVMSNNPAQFKGEKRPVETITWWEAKQFIDWLNRMKAIKDYLTGQGLLNAFFRLPYEAEWEFAARGGTYSQGYTYCGSDKLKQVGWHGESNSRETQDVGLLLANELGLFDMSGNVWEWCKDKYGWDFYKKCKAKGMVTDPSGPGKSQHRVVRGGSYLDDADNCHPAYRNGDSPNYQSDHFGFRVCLSLQ